MRYTWPKKKLCRREGINLFWTEKYDLSKTKRVPLKSRKTSEFGTQLRKKQLAKRMFGLSEKQFSSYFKKAGKSKAKKQLTEAQEFEIMKLVLDKFLWLGFAIMAIGFFVSVSGGSLFNAIAYLVAGALVLVLFMILIVKEYEIVK